jgi:phosphoglycolate phosphatase
MTTLGLTQSTCLVRGDRILVLFDWNGTVVLDHDRAREALNAALSAHGIGAVSSTDFASTFRLPMGDMFADLGVAAIDLRAAETAWNVYMASHRSQLRAGAASALAVLRDAGARLGIVSAAALEAVDFDRASLGVPEVWASVDAAAVDKVAVLTSYRAERELAFYVGDTAYDMTSALAAGYVPIGVSGGYATTETLLAAGAAHLVDDFDDLLELVTALAAVPTE